MVSVNPEQQTLDAPAWQAQRHAVLARLRPIAAERIERHGTKHPVYDFLFEYYSFRAAHVLRWSAGVDVELRDALPADTGWPTWYERTPHGCVLRREQFPEKRLPYLRWAIDYLEQVQQRAPHYGCFGLHEWAMVYRTPERRHQRIPLRLSAEATDRVVDQHRLCCTHYDAYRFFTPDAAPQNRQTLSHATMPQFDQPACIHATMDLYKFAYKLAPFTPSWLLADALELAAAARTVDMRASPYDLRALGLEPICIEMRTGRDEYVLEQKQLVERASPVRRNLLLLYRSITG